MVIALCHLLLIWNGDILCLYAVLGMILPLFHKMSNKRLLLSAFVLLALPVGIDLFVELSGIVLSEPLYEAWWAKAHSVGINESNFATWLRDATNYPTMFAFLSQGWIERMWEFVDGNRVFKVLGLFVLGYAIGRNRLYAKIAELKPQTVKLMQLSALVGIPLSAVYAWDSVNGHPLGLTVHSLLYFLSVVPMAFFYLTLLCLYSLRHKHSLMLRLFAAPGRMALTNYVGQSLIGIIIYYGVGFGRSQPRTLCH